MLKTIQIYEIEKEKLAILSYILIKCFNSYNKFIEYYINMLIMIKGQYICKSKYEHDL